MSKTVLFVIDDFHVGGAIAFMDQHARVLAKNGYRIIFLGNTGNLNNPKGVFPYATVIEVAGAVGFGSWLGRLRWGVKLFFALDEVFRTYSPTVLHTSLTYSSFVVYLHPKVWRTPRIYAFCGDIALEMESANIWGNSLTFKVKNFLRYVLQCVVVLNSTKIVTFSGYAKTLLTSRFPFLFSGKIAVIPAYIAPLWKEFKIINKDSIRLLTVNRFEPRKGLDNLLKAVKILNDLGLNCKLTIAGSCDHIYLSYFFEVYEELNLFQKVHFIHKVSSEQIQTLLNQADIYIVASKDLETFGMMTLVALASGTPVVGTPTGATPEILGSIDKSLIAKSTSAEDIARAIKGYVALQAPTRKKVLMQIRAQVIKHYDQGRIARKILQFYQQL